MPARASTTPMIRSTPGQSGFSIDPRLEEAHWRFCHEREAYSRNGLDFEDYAPAYCVGYVGCVQYGGSYEDAQTSLHANWVRIKGDSRLSLDEACLAIRAAWDRVASHAAEQMAWHVDSPPGDQEASRSPENVAPRGTNAPHQHHPAPEPRELAST